MERAEPLFAEALKAEVAYRIEVARDQLKPPQPVFRPREAAAGDDAAWGGEYGEEEADGEQKQKSLSELNETALQDCWVGEEDDPILNR